MLTHNDYHLFIIMDKRKNKRRGIKRPDLKFPELDNYTLRDNYIVLTDHSTISSKDEKPSTRKSMSQKDMQSKTSRISTKRHIMPC